MKNQFFNVFAVAAVLFLVSCAGNPTESEEYKSMVAGYETMVKEQTASQSAIVTLQNTTKQLMGALGALGEESNDIKGELMNRARNLMSKDGEMMKAHAEMSAEHAAMLAKHSAGMKMDAIKANFETIKANFAKMTADYSTMESGHNQINQAIQNALAAATEATE